MVLPSYQQDWAQAGTGWASNNFSAPYSYEQRPSSARETAYGPSYIPLGSDWGYAPASGMTYRILQERWDKWVEKNYPELFQFEQTGAGDPNVGQVGFLNNNFDANADRYILAAGQKYGVPPNLIKALIGHESEGLWSRDGDRYVFLDDRGYYILPYVGLTDPAVRSLGVSNPRSLVGNQAAQIDLMAKLVRNLYDDVGDEYGWQGVIYTYYSGDPTGNYTPPDSLPYGTTREYGAKVMGWWNQMDQQVNQNTRNYQPQGPVGGGTQLGVPQSEKWQPVNRWDQTIMQAAQRYGVPPNLIKAVMQVESGGDPTAGSHAGAYGLMQIMPNIWNGTEGYNVSNPNENIFLGAYILRQYYDQHGGWDRAAMHYHGIGWDGITTEQGYWQKVNAAWEELDAASSGLFGGPGGDRGPVSQVEAIWGGGDRPISQEHGPTHFSTNVRPEWYDYSIGVLGTRGHPGIDVSMDPGTALYTPVAGTVIRSGGSTSYSDERYGARNGTGELRLRLDNGDELILGHMQRIDVQPGDRVTPGQPVGQSGTFNGGHVHIEYRTPDSSMGSGWRAIDPREALGGQYTGSFGSGTTSSPGIGRPMTYQDLLLAAARGETISPGQAFSSGSGWNDWLRQAMFGQPTSWDLSRPTGQAYVPRAAAGYVGGFTRSPFAGTLE